MNALLTMSSVVFPLITSSHVARVLGPNGTGIVDLSYRWLLYFSMIASAWYFVFQQLHFRIKITAMVLFL